MPAQATRPIARRALLTAALGTVGTAGVALGAAALVRRQARAQAGLPPGWLGLVQPDGLWLTGTDGGARRLAPAAQGGWLQDPTWTPDGARLVYTDVRWPTLGQPQAAGDVPWPSAEVYAVRASDAAEAPEPLIRQERPKETYVSASFSSDGRWLYAVRRRPSPTSAYDAMTDLVRVPATGGSVEALDVGMAPNEIATSASGGLAAIGGPKGLPTGSVTDALVLLGDGGPQTIATADPNLQFLALPRFSPDGRQLAFVGGGPLSASTPAPRAIGPSALLLPLARRASAHGTANYPWIADLESGQVRRLLTPQFDDVTGLAWLNADQLLLLDAAGLALVTIESATVQRFTSFKGSGLAWRAA